MWKIMPMVDNVVTYIFPGPNGLEYCIAHTPWNTGIKLSNKQTNKQAKQTVVDNKRPKIVLGGSCRIRCAVEMGLRGRTYLRTPFYFTFWKGGGRFQPHRLKSLAGGRVPSASFVKVGSVTRPPTMQRPRCHTAHAVALVVTEGHASQLALDCEGEGELKSTSKCTTCMKIRGSVVSLKLLFFCPIRRRIWKKIEKKVERFRRIYYNSSFSMSHLKLTETHG